MNTNRGLFASRLGVVLATAGSAVGLGNIWRFPYMTGQNGGTAFILIYFACVLVLGIPGMVSEFIVGRHGASNAARAYGQLVRQSRLIGIMGIVTGIGVSGISLGGVMADACIRISNPVTYPLLTFLCAAVLNLFVPSGGGHWAVQAPVMFTAGANLAVDPGLTGMAIAWGDAWTNLIQPFWALPALAIARLDAKDIMGYCLIDLLVTGVIIAAGLLFWAM